MSERYIKLVGTKYEFGRMDMHAPLERRYIKEGSAPTYAAAFAAAGWVPAATRHMSTPLQPLKGVSCFGKSCTE